MADKKKILLSIERLIDHYHHILDNGINPEELGKIDSCPLCKDYMNKSGWPCTDCPNAPEGEDYGCVNWSTYVKYIEDEDHEKNAKTRLSVLLHWKDIIASVEGNYVTLSFVRDAQVEAHTLLKLPAYYSDFQI